MKTIVEQQKEVVSYLLKVAEEPEYSFGTMFKSILLFILIECGVMGEEDIENKEVQEIMQGVFQDYLDEDSLSLINEDIFIPLSEMVKQALRK